MTGQEISYFYPFEKPRAKRLPSKLFLADIIWGKTDRLGGIIPKNRSTYFSCSSSSSLSFPIRLRRRQESDAKHGILFYVNEKRKLMRWESER